MFRCYVSLKESRSCWIPHVFPDSNHLSVPAVGDSTMAPLRIRMSKKSFKEMRKQDTKIENRKALEQKPQEIKTIWRTNAKTCLTPIPDAPCMEIYRVYIWLKLNGWKWWFPTISPSTALGVFPIENYHQQDFRRLFVLGYQNVTKIENDTSLKEENQQKYTKIRKHTSKYTPED